LNPGQLADNQEANFQIWGLDSICTIDIREQKGDNSLKIKHTTVRGALWFV